MNRLGIVILNYDTYKDTIRLVTDLQNQKGEINLEIVVVDNCSPNDSYSILKKELNHYSNTKIVQSGTNSGYAKGNNFGLKILEQNPPEYVVIMNNDIYIDDNLLFSLLGRYKSLPDVGFIAPLQYIDDNKLLEVPSLSIPGFMDDYLMNFLLYRLLKRKHKNETNIEFSFQKVDIILGSLMFTSFDLFKEIGYFHSNTFLFGEERFVAMKIKKIRKNNYIISDLKFIHKHSTTIGKHVNNFRKNKYLHDSKMEFTRVYRRFAKLKCFCLNVAYLWGSIELSVFNAFLKIYHLRTVMKSILKKSN